MGIIKWWNVYKVINGLTTPFVKVRSAVNSLVYELNGCFAFRNLSFFCCVLLINPACEGHTENHLLLTPFRKKKFSVWLLELHHYHLNFMELPHPHPPSIGVEIHGRLDYIMECTIHMGCVHTWAHACSYKYYFFTDIWLGHRVPFLLSSDCFWLLKLLRY